MSVKRVYFVGVGGQGNVLATKLVGEAALASNVQVSISETHGMAQRGGVVASTAVIGARSPIISDGKADGIVAFEPLEALRVLPKANKDTVLITSLSKIQPFTVAIGKGVYPDIDHTLDYLKSKV
jgi:indolepyruvate ferredoxin oxidoreductase, beta subunit